jgi:hypothetical protein
LLRDIPLIVGGTAQRSSLAMTAPKDILAGHQQEIQGDWDLKIGRDEGTAEESPPAVRLTDKRITGLQTTHPRRRLLPEM